MRQNASLWALLPSRIGPDWPAAQDRAARSAASSAGLLGAVVVPPLSIVSVMPPPIGNANDSSPRPLSGGRPGHLDPRIPSAYLKVEKAIRQATLPRSGRCPLRANISPGGHSN